MEEELKELEDNKLKIEKEIAEKTAVLKEEKETLKDEIDFYSYDAKEVKERIKIVEALEKEIENLESLQKMARIRLGEMLKRKIQKEEKYIVTKIELDEYKKLHQIARSFIDQGKCNKPPEFVIITGGVAAGKTTVRRQSFAQNYVNLDYWDIYLAVEKEFGQDNKKLPAFPLPET